jgi:pimeloyl-ACP methyl ester carboxylesterase
MLKNAASRRDRIRANAIGVTLAWLGALPCAPALADDTAYAIAQQRIDIGGRKLNLYCIGSGSPTVIFESGLSDWSFSWALVQPQIATTNRACSYDRAGLGYSDPVGSGSGAKSAGSSASMVDDLHRLLRAAHIDPPYVLVGHSMGGLNMRLYADRFLQEVAGMVLVDPSHEDGIARIDAQRSGQESRRYRAEVRRLAGCVATPARTMASAGFRQRCIEPDDPRYSTTLNDARVAIARQPTFQRAQLAETVNYLNGRSFADVRQARRWYGALPLVVLTAGQTVAQDGPDWLQMHRELAALSSQGVQRTVTDTGHYIQLDRPAEVIMAIRQVLEAHSSSRGN